MALLCHLLPALGNCSHWQSSVIWHMLMLGLLLLLFRTINFLLFLVKDSVNWKQLKVNCKLFIKKNILKLFKVLNHY